MHKPIWKRCKTRLVNRQKMKKLKRKDFIKKIVVLTAATAVMPKILFAGNVKPFSAVRMPVDLSVFSFNENALIDLHCHPSLKMYLMKKKMWKRHWLRSPGDNDLHMQEDLHEFSAGNVRGMVATHYLPESGVETQWSTAKSLWNILRHFYIGEQIESEDGHNFDQINEMLTDLEEQIIVTNQKQDRVQFVIACSYKEFIQALNDPAGNIIPMAHAIEGAHSLGRNVPVTAKKENDPNYKKFPMTHGIESKTDSSLYLERLQLLKERGVCLITLGHFFKNDLVYPVDGISPNDKKFPGMAWEFTPDKDHKLTQIGCDVVTQMLTTGMIVDLTHSAPGCRRDVFDINRDLNKKRKVPRPLVFTHVGAQRIFDYYDQGHYPYYKYYDVSDEEIDWICECNGVIGVIPENFWLVGADTHLHKEFPPKQFQNGISYMIETMKYINSKTWTKDYDNVGIGTDFDGLADNPKDLYLNSQLSALFQAMELDGEFTAEQIKKITRTNALRLLETGWGD
jgi:microsomal dipeptidase-like Zn-dependent dipeptidase